jgi:methyl-accepting chemotaxis protein
MDRITQSNAANAEESASASEELSAQAADLNSMVAELGVLVNGADAATAAHQPTRRPAARRAAVPRAAPAQRARPLTAMPAKRRAPMPALEQANGLAPHPAELSPKELIPLDDTELQGF